MYGAKVVASRPKDPAGRREQFFVSIQFSEPQGPAKRGSRTSAHPLILIVRFCD